MWWVWLALVILERWTHPGINPFRIPFSWDWWDCLALVILTYYSVPAPFSDPIVFFSDF